MKNYVKTLIATLVLAVAIIWGTGSDAFAISQKEADASPEININEVFTDKLDGQGSVKWYKVNITERGYFVVNFAPNEKADDESISWGWNCSIYKKGDLTSPIYEFDRITEADKSSIITYAPDTFYLKVENGNDYVPALCAMAPFDIKVEFTKNNYWEQEVNNKVTQANQIGINTKYYGVMSDKDDVDWFKFSVPEGGVGSFTMTPDLDLSDLQKLNDGWEVTLYSGDLKKEIVKISDITKPTDSKKLNLKKGIYMVQVKCTHDLLNFQAPVEQPYNLTISFEGYSQAIAKTKVKILKPKAAKKKATIKWKKISYASGYEIYRSTKKNKGFKKVGTVNSKKTKFISKKLKSKKKYYYKVRAFVKVGNKKFYSQYSAVKNVKAK